MPRLSRRQLLAGVVGTVAGGAGCLAGDSSRSEMDPLSLDSVDVGQSSGDSVRVRVPGVATLLDFFATWCAPCKPQMASLVAVREAHPDLHMLSITQEKDRAAIESFWQQYDGAWPVAPDPALRATEAYGVDRIPTLIVLAADGSEVWRHTGLASLAAIESAVDEARA